MTIRVLIRGASSFSMGCGLVLLWPEPLTTGQLVGLVMVVAGWQLSAVVGSAMHP